MRRALILGWVLLSAPAAAQTTYRCQSSIGQVTFQDRPCPRMTGAESLQATPLTLSSLGDWNSRQTQQRRQQARIESAESATRVKAHLQSQNDQRVASDAASQRKCRDAMQIAQLCGKFAGMFSCGDKGFVRQNIADDRLRGAGGETLSAHRIERCALQAANGNLMPSGPLSTSTNWRLN